MLLRRIAESTGGANDTDTRIDLGCVATAPDHAIEFTPESLFGRHCAVLGATGGGKSWTVARLIEQCSRHKSKSILIDATGEFHTLTCSVRHCHLSRATDGQVTEVVIPYRQLTESDLLALFRPSGQSQAPKLRMAMKSLKLCQKEPKLGDNGVIRKAGKARKPYEDAWRAHAEFVDGPSADFDISKLCDQITEECIFATDRNDASRFGGPTDNERVFCVGLLTRIDQLLHSNEIDCILKPGAKRSLFDEIDDFLNSPTDKVLRISMKHVSFAYNVREIVANAVGRFLLAKARSGAFANKPLLVFLDEAHQFLDQAIGEEGCRPTTAAGRRARGEVDP